MTDDEYGALLMQPLDGDPVGPSRVDVAQAMRDGRRMHRRWWAGLSGFSALALLVGGGLLLAPTGEPDRPDLPPDPPLPTACSAGKLPAPGMVQSFVSGSDRSGHVLVGSGGTTIEESDRVLIWRDGRLTDDRPAPTADFLLHGVNAAGLAVGTSIHWTNGELVPERPWFYRDGAFAHLRGSDPGEAVAVNDAGVIVGTVTRAGRKLPVRWASADAEPEFLPLPDGASHVTVRDIAEDGTVLAASHEATYLWHPGGDVDRIPPPDAEPVVPSAAPGERQIQEFDAGALRNGWIVGVMQLRDRKLPYRYDPRSRTWQQLSEGTLGAYLAVEDYTYRAEAGVFVGRRILPLPVPAGDSFMIATTSDDGHVVTGVAQGTEPGDDAVIWRCR